MRLGRKRRATQAFSDFRSFTEPEGSLPCSNDPTTTSESDERGPHLNIVEVNGRC
jgi:hypothetical protein